MGSSCFFMPRQTSGLFPFVITVIALPKYQLPTKKPTAARAYNKSACAVVARRVGKFIPLLKGRNLYMNRAANYFSTSLSWQIHPPLARPSQDSSYRCNQQSLDPLLHLLSLRLSILLVQCLGGSPQSNPLL